MNIFNIRTAVIEDAKAIAKLEREHLTCPWSLAVIEKEIRENHLAQYLVLTVETSHEAEGERGSRIIGSVGYWKVGIEWSINNVVISKQWQGKGLGTMLLTALKEKATKEGALQLMLEVGEGNEVARRLYENVGFFINGKREEYYSGEKEAALLMSCLLGE